MNRLRDSRAFTLVEMLVVIAIISILTAIAVPTMGKLGMFGRDPITVAARQTLVMLKAARIYAGAHNVDTAVVYSVVERKDSDSGAPVKYIDGLALARRLTKEETSQERFPSLTQAEYEALYQDIVGSEKDNLLPFVFVKGEGSFQYFPEGAGIFQYDDVVPASENTPIPVPPAWPLITDWDEDAGLCEIRVIESTFFPVTDITPRTNAAYSPSGNLTNGFPAHVFKPSGVLQVPSGYDKSRFTLYVSPAPDAEHNKRYYKDSGGTEYLVPPERIEIYSTIGRIQAAS